MLDPERGLSGLAYIRNLVCGINSLLYQLNFKGNGQGLFRLIVLYPDYRNRGKGEFDIYQGGNIWVTFWSQNTKDRITSLYVVLTRVVSGLALRYLAVSCIHRISLGLQCESLWKYIDLLDY